MGSQLFYTYSSDTGNYADSANAILNIEAYTYSLVFDTQRRTVWAQDIEYGVVRTTRIDQNIDTNYIRNTGVPFMTYNGAISYMYVTSTGLMTMYNGCSIISFDMYYGDNIATGSIVDPGQQIDLALYTLKAKCFGSGIERIYMVSNPTNGEYFDITIDPDSPTSSTTINGNLPDMVIEQQLSGSINGLSLGDVVDARLKLEDNIGNVAIKDIPLFKVRALMWYGVKSWNGTDTDLPLWPQSTQGFYSREIEPMIEDIIPSTTNDQYFWLIIPQSFSIRMEQGGGDADLETYYEMANINNVSYKVYRTPRTNVGGARYKLYIS